MTSVGPVAQNGNGKWSSPSSREMHPAPSKQGRGFARILTSWRAFRDSLAPMGYEDETGFHYGNERKETES